MPAPEVGTMLWPLWVLFNKGIRYSTVVDIGCADGNFFLTAFVTGLIPGAIPLNIDANPVYQESLQAIQKVVGGHFKITAVTDHEGEIGLTTSVHPYWSSLRPEGDPYWQRVNRLSTTRTSVPATTLDTLSKELALQPPFLLKLDVQGSEKNVLKGASEFLKNSHLVICEADIDDFEDINTVLVQNNFVLYDVTHLQRLANGTLGWFYPVFINRSLDFVRPKAFWDEKDNEAVIRAQVERRKAILNQNANLLTHIQAWQKMQRSGDG
ncbi:MAG TPA: FkbM family methyltransferase [Bryobacteraceae bacterium]|jgi:FkbM family methyltransferase